MFNQGISWLFQDTDQIIYGQLLQSCKNGQASNQLRNNSEFLNIFCDDFLHIRAVFVNGLVVLSETNDFFTQTLFDNFFDSIEGTTYNEEDVLSVHLNHFLLWMFTSTLRRYASYSSFDNLEKGLLHTFTRNITCDRNILTLLSNLVNLIDIDNPTFCAFNVKISCLQKFEEDIFNVLTHIASFSKSCCIRYSKWYIQTSSKSLSKESLP